MTVLVPNRPSRKPEWRLISIEPQHKDRMDEILFNITRKRKKVVRKITLRLFSIHYEVKIKASELTLIMLSMPLVKNEKLWSLKLIT